MVSVNNIILKKCFKLYDSQSIYSEYSKIAFKYHKSFKENHTKKVSPENQEKLKEDVKKWFFSQSLESRMKICTVENEHFGKIIYQMYYQNKLDKTVIFKPKPEFFDNEDDKNNEQFSNNISNINNFKNEDELNYKNMNNNIKITKTNKNGKKIEAPTMGIAFSQMSLNDFNQEEDAQNNYGNYFTFFSLRGNYTLAVDNSKKKILEKSKEDFFNNILYFSVHHRYYPDCFTLSPEILLEKEKLENYFANLGNPKYFCNLIQSYIYNNSSSNTKIQKFYGYKFPDWLLGDKTVEEIQHTVTQYAIAFFEQVIMIKYLLNKNEKKIKYFSLIDEEALNRFFSDRKLAINYMKKNYTQENKMNILKELNMDEIYKKIITNKDKIKYVNYFKKYKYIMGSEKNPYIDSINCNPHSNKYEEQYNKMNKITKQKNTKNTKNMNGELTYDEILEKYKNYLNMNDIIYFIDYLLFDNYINLWKLEFFMKGELFDKLSKLIIDKNCNELIFDYSNNQSKSNKSKHRKKNKKNKKEEEKNNNNNNNTINNNNKIQDEYGGIFKDEEEEMYAPYYLKANTEQKKLYLKSKELNNINNINNDINKVKEIDEIRNFISKEIILGLVIDRIFLIPLNNCLDFYEKYNEKEEDTNNNKDKNNFINDNINQINTNQKEETTNNIIINKEENIIIEDIKEKEIKDDNNDLDNDDLSVKKSESMTVTTQDTTNNINININLENTPSKAKEVQ